MLSHQSAYCKRVFEQFRMGFAKSMLTPVADDLDNLLINAYRQEFLSREVTGGLLYLRTRT